MAPRDVGKLVASLALPFLAGAIGSAFTAPAIPAWYATLAKPLWAPPNWLFGPVWTLLYLLMGISLFLAWRSRSPSRSEKRLALRWYAAQLVLNALWSILFFGMRMPALAFVGIVGLWLAILLTMRSFLKVSERAAWLLLPYALWVSFALLLNLGIAVLNA